MGILENGIWFGGDDKQIGAAGWEPRQEKLRGVITAKGQAGSLPAEADRYHLIHCPGCPLSHRTKMALHLKGLDKVITSSRVLPVMGGNGREFDGGTTGAPDPVTGFHYLHEAYVATDPTYSGRASTPVLWDKQEGRIVSNCYSDILDMLNSAFDAFAVNSVDLRPASAADELAAELSWLGQNLTGAVYRCGFSRDQSEFDLYVERIGRAAPELERKLAERRYLVGDAVSEADLSLLACLLRFDAIYLPLFKCTSARIADHPAICAWCEHMLTLPGVAESFDLKASMTHYFLSHAHINPSKIVPPAPRLGWTPPAVSNPASVG